MTDERTFMDEVKAHWVAIVIGFSSIVGFLAGIAVGLNSLK